MAKASNDLYFLIYQNPKLNETFNIIINKQFIKHSFEVQIFSHEMRCSFVKYKVYAFFEFKTKNNFQDNAELDKRI